MHEYLTQENDSTAFPYYWVIRDRKAHPDNWNDTEVFALVHDGEAVYYDVEEYESEDEVKKWVIHDRFEDEPEATQEDIDGYLEEISIVPCTWVNHDTGLFLFKEEAQKHLKSNKHHYSEWAHVYCKHAWRSPKTASFIREACEAPKLEPFKNDRSFLLENGKPIEGPIIYHWKPRFVTDDEYYLQDLALEYVVISKPNAVGSIVVYADHGRGYFEVNPWNKRHLIKNLIDQLAGSKAL